MVLWTKRKGKSEAADELAWSADIPLTGKAMLKAGDHLFIAGTPMEIGKNDLKKIVDSYEQRGGGRLWVASAADGEKLAEYELDAAPAWDGMAVADGRLFIAMKDGSLRCWGGK